MPHVICAPCIGTTDRACVVACPVDCIYDAGAQLVIDPERCVDCSACVSACPVSAIFPSARVPSEWAGYAKLNSDRALSLRSAR